MLTQEENELYTRVGPGTPAGELLRRFWHPVAVARDLTEQQPTLFVRVLGEDLVLFRDQSGRVGLLADHCAHRGASLLYGRVEERGIACAYHGWLFDTEGHILETPPERNEAIMKHCRQRSYPVRRFIGLYWAYLGPAPVPQIPLYDVWARTDGYRRIVVQPRLDASWLQAMENSVDPDHLQILHQEFFRRGRKPPSTTRGFIDDIGSTDFYTVPYGLMKRRVYKNGRVDEHPVIFPTILRHSTETQIRIPIDDTHTTHIHVVFVESTERHDNWPDCEDAEVVYVPPFKQPADGHHPEARFRLDEVLAQDHMAWETQGPIANRTVENLSYSDRGVFLFRRLLQENIERVAQGQDPMGVVRDPDNGIIDTGLQVSLDSLRLEGLPAPR